MFGGDLAVLYLDCGDGHGTVYISNLVESYNKKYEL